MKICDINQCCGCMACVNACPKNAVTMIENRLGAPVPRINEDACISCGLCVKACPINNLAGLLPENPGRQACYALVTRDPEDKRTCSSGGVATTLSRHILRQGGSVFGAAFDGALDLRHIGVTPDNEGALELLKGSKYVQSRIGNAYKAARQLLREGRVLFIGAPCQIAGLRSFLGQAYDNLLTVDFVCHGTPPARYLKEYLGRKYPALPIASAGFRGGGEFKLTLYDSFGNALKEIPAHMDPYYDSFLKGITYRKNCYNCPFAGTRRVSDLTIGDFWGIDRSALPPEIEGRVSLLLSNTEKGAAAFEITKHLFVFQERPLDEAIAGNEQLNHPVSPPAKDRRIFEAGYPKLGFTQALRKTPHYRRWHMRQLIKSTPLGSFLKRLKNAVK